MRLRRLFLFAALLLTAAACSSSTTEQVPAAESTSATGQATGQQSSDAAPDAAAASPEEDPGATLTVGDQTWTFNALICAISIAEEGQTPIASTIRAFNDKASFALTTHPTGGDFADVTDFELESPTVILSSDAAFTSITIEGKSFTGTGEFLDRTTESLDLIPGTFSGTCS